MKKKLNLSILMVISFFSIFAVWSLLTFTGLISEFFLPTPLEVLKSILRLILLKSFLGDIAASFFRVFVGFFISILIAIPLGILIGTNKKVEAASEPLIILRYIPPSALIPLAILWFGIGETEKIFIVILSILPYFVLLIADIVSHTPIELIDAAKTLGAKTRVILSRIILPFNAPKIFESIRFMFAVGWAYIIMVELVGAESGLGHFIMRSQRFMHTADMFAGIIVIAILGIGVDFGFRFFYKRLFPWAEKVAKNE